MMKTKKSILILPGLFLLMTFGCSEDLAPVTYETNAKLKRTLMYSSAKDITPIAIVDEYEYDDRKRISKVSSPSYHNGNITGTAKYNLYEYNSAGQIERISNFNANINSPTGYINLANYSYTYNQNGLKAKQLIEYPQINGSEHTLYIYDGAKLVKAERYSKQLEDYITYEYKENKLVKEVLHSAKGESLTITKHSYTNGLNSKTEIYRGNEKIREINKTYDSNYNLIMIESKELTVYSSAISYVMRYEYEESY